MIDQYHIVRKKLQAGIMISLIAFALSGCARQEQEMEEPEPPVEKANPSIPKNKTSKSSFIECDAPFLKVKIHNAGEYRIFVDSLEEYLDCHDLNLYMQETDTVIYLDEILAYHNFTNVEISSGGVISARNMDDFKENPLEELELYHIYAIEENIVSQLSALENVKIWLNSDYSGVFPAKELVHNTNCGNIAMILDDNKKYEAHLEELAEWEEIEVSMSESDSYLKGLYVWNEEKYNYTSYEFCEEGAMQACAAFICIKDRESFGEKYFDVLEVPVESVEVDWSAGSRMMLDDINFDGHRDLIFTGWNRLPGNFQRQCIGFLWNEKEQKYEWNATAPKHYRGIDDEREIIIDIYTSSLQDEYFIYEYHDGIFTEKKLEVISSLTDYYFLAWQYYEDGKLLKRLEKNYDEETKLYYITYEENGNVTEKVMEEAEYDNRYASYSDLGEEYFPEFDFYWKG